MRSVIKNLLLLVAFVPAVAHAAEGEKLAQARTGIQLRVEETGTNKKVGDAPGTTSEGIVVKTARIGVSGDLAESISYTLRLDVKNALYGTDPAAQPGFDSAIPALDRAFIEQRFNNDMLKVKIGRMPVRSLSIENDYSSMDLYYISYIAEIVTYKEIPILAGVDLTAQLGPHALTLQVFNGVQEVSGAHKGVQTGEDRIWTLAYVGNLLNGAVKPIISYNRLGRIRAGNGASRDAKAVYAVTGIGSQFSFAHADLDLEYDTFSKPAFTSHTWAADPANPSSDIVTEVKNLKDDITSVITQIAYNFTEAHLRPFFKYSVDNEKVDSKAVFKANRFAIGSEYRPVGKAFRYHLVAVDKKDEATDPASSKKTLTKTRQYILGIAAKI